MRTTTVLPAMLLAAASAVLAGCASTWPHQTRAESRERFIAYSGAPVERFTYLGHYENWQALGPDSLVLWTNLNTAYLLTFMQPCSGLNFAQRIGLTSTGGTVSARFDSVRFDHDQVCFIQEIRPVDYRRMQADRRANAAKAKRAAGI